MIKYIYILILFIISFSSCSDKTVKDNYHIIDVNNASKEVFNWAERIQINEIIPLEVTDRSLLGIAQKCLVKNNLILFLDYKMKSIYVFNIEGTFLFSIDSQGGGSEEYTELKDAVFSNDGKKIFLLDHTAIVTYDAIDGHFLDKINLNMDYSVNFYRFIHLNDDVFYFFADSGEYTIYRYTNGNLSGVRKSKGYQLIYERFHCQYDGCCLLAPDYGFFNIDEITEEGLIPKYYVDFGNKSMPKSMLPKNSREFDKVEKEHYFKSIVEIKETDQGIYIQAVDPESRYYDIYLDKLSGRMISGLPDRSTSLVFVDVDTHYYYGLIYPDYLSRESPLYNKLQKYIKEDGNPILIKFLVDINLD